MSSLHPGITGRADLEPLAVSPRQACVLLNVGLTRLYELLGSGELESYLDGRSRRITMRSIHRRIKRLLKDSGAEPAGRRPHRKIRTEFELNDQK
jgi:excisionase family DNA binding protein